MIPYWNYPRDEPPVFGHIDGLPVPYPRQYLARVMPQVPQTHGVRIRSRHANNVSQNCGHKNTDPAVRHVTSAEDRWLLARPEVGHLPDLRIHPVRAPGHVTYAGLRGRVVAVCRHTSGNTARPPRISPVLLRYAADSHHPA